MKTRRKLFAAMRSLAIIALAAVIGFGVAACESPTVPDSKNPGGSESKSLTGITVTTPPTKVQYNLGEDFDPAGMVVTATYSDSSTEVVTGYTFSGYDKTVAENQMITVTYKEKSDTFFVRVIDPSLPSAEQPTATPPAGAVASGTTVTLTTATEGATIYYTTNGDIPTVNGNVYASPIAITAAITIKAIAVKDGMNDSTVLEAAYTIQTVTPGNQTPVAGDFDISGAGTYTYDGTPKSVTITPKQGKSTGDITIYYNDSTTAPSAVGTYTVTFDVAAATGFNAATGLSAGTLTINAATPVADDFVIGNLTQAKVHITAVTITPKAGKSGGAITIYYNGSTTLPTTVGTYTVTFDVAAITGWKTVTGLSAGTLTIIEAHFIGVQFSGFGDEAVDLAKSIENDIHIGESLIVTVNGDFDAYYQFYQNGNYLTYTYSNNYSLYIGGWFPIGIHTITAVVTKNDIPYSKEVTFRVVR